MKIFFQALIITTMTLCSLNVHAASKLKTALEEKDTSVNGPVFYQLPEMVVNIRSLGKATRILKIKLNLELDSTDDITIVDKIKPRMINDFQVYLRHLYPDDFDGDQMTFLKDQLLVRANYTASPIKFKDVLFRGLLIQ